MKNSIVIKSISLLNFKGIKNQTIEFGKVTDIFGANGTGKTTIFDAFTWCLFGKDSTDRKDFNVKNTKEKSLNKTDHEVIVVMDVIGITQELRRVYRENWVKKRGFEEKEFAGNVTEYYWNGVPMQQKEFQQRISEVLEEGIFKLITNPLALNSMKWQDRRNILTAMAPISNEELANGNEAFEKLLQEASSYKSLEDYKKMIKASIKKAKDDIALIPARIDEVTRQKPESLDFVKIQSDLDAKGEELKSVDNQIQNANAGTEVLVSQRREQSIKIGNLENEITNTESVARNEANKPTDDSELTKLTNSLRNKTDDLKSGEYGLESLTNLKSSKETRIKELDTQMDAKREQWTTENAKEITFNDNDFHCPTCKREFEAGDVDAKKAEAIQNFKNKKAETLNEINRQGGILKQEKENLEVEVKNLEIRLENSKNLVETLSKEVKEIGDKIEIYNSTASGAPKDTELIYQCILSENADYKAKKEEVEKLKASLVVVPEVDNSALVEKRKLIVDEIDNLKGQLNLKTQIDNCNRRISELEQEETTLAQQIANVEKIEFAIEKFNKLKVDTLENEINKRFKYVKFRMFDTQINGGEAECCDALIDGVPFSDANTASKINAGIDIINTLCEFYQVTAPIFIDNRESIIELIDSESQIVNLIVSGEDKKLRVA
jgi:exonuclease SbcC